MSFTQRFFLDFYCDANVQGYHWGGILPSYRTVDHYEIQDDECGYCRRAVLRYRDFDLPGNDWTQFGRFTGFTGQPSYVIQEQP
jgi:hypothetical protein